MDGCWMNFINPIECFRHRRRRRRLLLHRDIVREIGSSSELLVAAQGAKRSMAWNSNHRLNE